VTVKSFFFPPKVYTVSLPTFPKGLHPLHPCNRNRFGIAPDPSDLRFGLAPDPSDLRFGLAPDPSDLSCRHFFFSGQFGFLAAAPRMYSCPNPLRFNPEIRGCDLAENVKCVAAANAIAANQIGRQGRNNILHVHFTLEVCSNGKSWSSPSLKKFPKFANCLWDLFTYNPVAQQAFY
jgi:hypothetical protein